MRKHTQPQETQPFEFLFICIDEDFMFVWVDIFARIQKDYQCNAESTPLTVMNETPISKADKFVCTYRSLLGIQHMPNWLKTLCLR